MPGSETTVTEVLADLAARGFGGDFHVAGPPAAVVCSACGHRINPADADVVELFRFEGESDPADESIVAALRCRVCGASGSLVAAYGMAADAVEADVLAGLVDRRSGHES